MHSDKSVMTREFKAPPIKNNKITNEVPHELFTMKQHNTVPGNQVAVHVFVREENGCCNVIQQLQEKEINVMLESTQQWLRHSITSGWFTFVLTSPSYTRLSQIPLNSAVRNKNIQVIQIQSQKTPVVSSAVLPAGSNQWLAAVSSSSSSRVSMLGPSSFRVNMWTESEHFSKSSGWIEKKVNNRFKQYFLKWQ